ncbi:MAG: hypothetical protein NTX53_08970 [candidate division WOR-3 bacterium]|nr:hypothetical protein [candidate division WOR-3 bacterium]
MTIRRTFELVTGAYLVIAAALGAVTGYLFFNQRFLEESQRGRFASYLLADELRQSSDKLTRFARLFVATGDERYRQYYNDLLALHTNEEARPVNYARLVLGYARGQARSAAGRLARRAVARDDYRAQGGRGRVRPARRGRCQLRFGGEHRAGRDAHGQG